ncbi:transcriptional regulator [uncultured Streptococcus sp.]|uniref:transcriptional regulator n=1 Tax=uncultured Streptococcus sp. TaxID=83427 RepID=UPI0028D723C1|nr:transcriptional regulator [uncultured Streptococcus sp.]
MKKLSDEDLKTLDRELFKFQNIQRTIDLRRLELETRKPDAQSGPTVGISKPTETIAIRIADDPTLKFLEGFKGIINKLLSNLVDEDMEIFNLRWRYPQLRWEEIAEQKFMSKATIYRRRRIILEQYAILKGEL